MESNTLKAHKRKKKRVLRIRRRIHGTSERPRLCFVKSNQHITVQVIDDQAGLTIASETTLSKEMRASDKSKSELAKTIGKLIAKACKEKGVDKAVLDRRGNKYHGLISAFADAAREEGLQF